MQDAYILKLRYVLGLSDSESTFVKFLFFVYFVPCLQLMQRRIVELMKFFMNHLSREFSVT